MGRGHKSCDVPDSGFLFPKRFEGGVGEAFPLAFDEFGVCCAGVDEKAVAQSQGLVGENGEGSAERGCGTHPAIVADVELDGVMEVAWVVHERDALVGLACDGPGVIDPTSGFPEASVFIDATFGVGDPTSPVVDPDRFCHANAEETERGRTDGDGILRGGEFGVDVDAPEIFGCERFLGT